MITRKGDEERIQHLECTLFFQSPVLNNSSQLREPDTSDSSGTCTRMHIPTHRDTHMHKTKIKNDETRQGRSEVVSTCKWHHFTHRESLVCYQAWLMEKMPMSPSQLMTYSGGGGNSRGGLSRQGAHRKAALTDFSWFCSFSPIPGFQGEQLLHTRLLPWYTPHQKLRNSPRTMEGNPWNWVNPLHLRGFSHMFGSCNMALTNILDARSVKKVNLMSRYEQQSTRKLN